MPILITNNAFMWLLSIVLIYAIQLTCANLISILLHACLLILLICTICYLCRLKAPESLCLLVSYAPTLNKSNLILSYLILWIRGIYNEISLLKFIMTVEWSNFILQRSWNRCKPHWFFISNFKSLEFKE